MGRAIFLDTGVVIGYCFHLDKHGIPCDRYIQTNLLGEPVDGYISDNVEREYTGRRRSKKENSLVVSLIIQRMLNKAASQDY